MRPNETELSHRWRRRRASLYSQLSTIISQPSTFLVQRPAVSSIAWLGGGVPWLATMSSHLVTKLHHAALVGFDLRQMESDVSVELLEERDAITNQYRQDRITNFVGQ